MKELGGKVITTRF